MTSPRRTQFSGTDPTVNWGDTPWGGRDGGTTRSIQMKWIPPVGCPPLISSATRRCVKKGIGTGKTMCRDNRVNTFGEHEESAKPPKQRQHLLEMSGWNPLHRNTRLLRQSRHFAPSRTRAHRATVITGSRTSSRTVSHHMMEDYSHKLLANSVQPHPHAQSRPQDTATTGAQPVSSPTTTGPQQAGPPKPAGGRKVHLPAQRTREDSLTPAATARASQQRHSHLPPLNQIWLS